MYASYFCLSLSVFIRFISFSCLMVMMTNIDGLHLPASHYMPGAVLNSLPGLCNFFNSENNLIKLILLSPFFR